MFRYVGHFDLSKAVGTTRGIWVYDLAHTPTVGFAQLAASRRVPLLW